MCSFILKKQFESTVCNIVCPLVPVRQISLTMKTSRLLAFPLDKPSPCFCFYANKNPRNVEIEWWYCRFVFLMYLWIYRSRNTKYYYKLHLVVVSIMDLLYPMYNDWMWNDPCSVIANHEGSMDQLRFRGGWAQTLHWTRGWHLWWEENRYAAK